MMMKMVALVMAAPLSTSQVLLQVRERNSRPSTTKAYSTATAPASVGVKMPP